MNALKRWRKSREWTQQEAADHCGVTQQTFGRAEDGRVSVATAQQIAGHTNGEVLWHEIFERGDPAPQAEGEQAPVGE